MVINPDDYLKVLRPKEKPEVPPQKVYQTLMTGLFRQSIPCVKMDDITRDAYLTTFNMNGHFCPTLMLLDRDEIRVLKRVVGYDLLQESMGCLLEIPAVVDALRRLNMSILGAQVLLLVEEAYEKWVNDVDQYIDLRVATEREMDDRCEDYLVINLRETFLSQTNSLKDLLMDNPPYTYKKRNKP